MRHSGYKKYFWNSAGTPSTIPRRTLFRQIRRTKLTPLFNLADSQRNDTTCGGGNGDAPDLPHVNEPPETTDPIEDGFSDSDLSTISSTDPELHYNLLFPQSKISKEESTRLIYAFLLRHRLSKEAVADLLTLVNFHLPSGVTVPASPFLLEKQIQPDFSIANRCFYCPNCETTIQTRGDECGNCQTDLKDVDLLKSGKFFIAFDVKASISKILETQSVSENLLFQLANRQNQSSSRVHDIVDGKAYQELGLNRYDFSCSINTDGVSIFNSSKFSIWPILISINELDYKLRRKHTILVGLWFGSKKPNFETFLKPLVEECNALQLDGITWMFKGQTYKSRVWFPIVAADSVARCSLQGIKQFNGHYGCPWCLIKGETLFQDGRKRKWIYLPAIAPKRTEENFRHHVTVLQNNIENGDESNCYGVKSESPFLSLNGFNIVNGFVFDYMHTCLLGVLRTFTNVWLDSKNHENDFYIGTRQDQISNRFVEFKVPFECNRVTRDLRDAAFWKANEWKTWLLACIPVLQDILKPAYLKHFTKFVHGISVLMSDKISFQDIDYAEVLLKEFCFAAPKLYGKEICSFNLHLLLHAADCVRNWGPLWCYSLFQFEHMNGILNKYFNGTSQICIQILRKVVITQQLGCLGVNGFKNDMAKHFFASLLEKKRYSNKAVKCMGITFLGAKRRYVFNNMEIEKLRKLDLSNINEGLSFKYFIVRNRKFSVAKCDTSKQCNSVIKIQSDLYIILKAMIVNSDGVDTPIIFAKKLTSIPLYNICNIRKVVRISECIKVFRLSLVQSCKFVCSFSSDGKLMYVLELCNLKESE